MTARVEIDGKELLMKVREIMTRRVIAATEETTAIDLARKVLAGFFSGLPVVDADGQVVGVVTEKDLLVLIADDPRKLHETRAADIMTSPATCVDEEAGIDEVIALILEKRFVRVPVTRNGVLVGIVSRSDVLNVFIKDTFVTYEDGEPTAADD